MLLSVAAIVLESLDPSRLAAWYRRHFAFVLDLEHEGGVFGTFETADGGFRFGLKPFLATPDAPKLRSVALTFRVDDIEAMIAHLQQEGLAPDVNRSTEGESYASVRDPEENIITLWGSSSP
mgnify:CR=1 FL=1